MPDDQVQPGRTTPSSFAGIVEDMYRTGDFRAVVLASADGLPVATAPPDYEGDLPSAMVALVRGVSHDVQAQLGMAELDEVAIYDRDRHRLVSRYVSVGTEALILAALVLPGRPYRRATNRAIRQIEKLLR